jgi:hypothetical protein
MLKRWRGPSRVYHTSLYGPIEITVAQGDRKQTKKQKSRSQGDRQEEPCLPELRKTNPTAWLSAGSWGRTTRDDGIQREDDGHS